MSKILETVREKIDAIDDQVHDLLMERAELVMQIADEKKKQNLPVVHPAREAKMIRRLLDRNRSPFPEEAVVRIWRELVGAVCMLQTGLKVAVVSDEIRPNGLWDWSRDYFGGVLPKKRVPNAPAALGMVRNGDVNFAVVPWPEDSEQHPWWASLIHQGDHAIQIVTKLPYGGEKDESLSYNDKALIVGRAEFKESGNDISFLVLETAEPISRGRLNESLEKDGHPTLGVLTGAKHAENDPSTYLIEVMGYIAPGNYVPASLKDALEERHGKCVCIGGYPIPPSFRKMDQSSSDRPVYSAKAS